ncbi:AAA family ATPase [Microvirga arabica]|uniref:AAA family ATPase n=1 Tax=Microvirga arabica TaxID=1128671 RepID=UPI00193AD055|nr:AAA family ATPase [Microvirga arabica]MBM1170188.1 AAA family ATPase [Microvirga arabica]
MTDDTNTRDNRVARMRDEIFRTKHDRLTLAGYLLSTTELLRGGPLYRQSLLDDGHEWLREYLPLMQGVGEEARALVDALEEFHDEFTAKAAYTAANAAKALMLGPALTGRTPKIVRQILDVYMRCMYYAWLLGHREAAKCVAALAFDLAMDSPGEVAQVEYLGTAVAAAMVRGTVNRERAHADGIAQAARLGGLAADFLTARGTPTDEQKSRISAAVGTALKKLMDNPEGSVQLDVFQALPEPELGDGDIPFEEPASKGKVVFPAFEAYQTEAESRRVSAMAAQKAKVGHLAGRVLPFDPPRPADEVYQALDAEFPYAEEANEAFAQDTVVANQRGYAWIRNSLLLGHPGLGKTRYARRLCEIVGLRYLLHSMAGQADGAVSGTNAQWSSARMSSAAQAAAHFECPNPCLIFDEADKAGTSTHNGNGQDALVPFLERESAARIIDPFLEMPLDLSCMPFLFTANELHRVSGPLLDRLRVLRIPKPRPEHLPTIAKTMVADMRAENDVDEIWMPDLSGGDLDLLAKQWKGGSMRRLRRLVEVLVASRATFASRH